MRPGAAAAVVLAGISLGGWAGCPRQAPVQSPPAAGQPGGEQAVKQGEEERPRVKLGEPADEKAARERAAERARAHLAKVLDVPSEQIAVESAKAATWPDASLGCPEPDRMYAQVVTDGYQVVLRIEDDTHEVHVAGARAVLCKKKQAGG